MNNHREMPEVAWYLIQCKPRQENRAGEHLARQGFESFSPTTRVEKLHAVNGEATGAAYVSRLPLRKNKSPGQLECTSFDPQCIARRQFLRPG